MTLHFAFRVDASPEIGSGHVMRCLTLAKDLRARGMLCSFICRDFPGNLSQRMKADGFDVSLLDFSPETSPPGWLGADSVTDADQTIAVLETKTPDWVIVDHYEIAAEWEAKVKSAIPTLKIMVIDDLVDRSHHCDLLMDQTYGREASEYASLVDENTRICVGSDFALLNPAFAEMRKLLRESKEQAIPHLFVSLGGGDTTDVLLTIFEGIEPIYQRCPFSMTIIAGKAIDEAKTRLVNWPGDVELLEFTDNMAAEMLQADLAVGAGGGTSWERCCMGLPSVVLTLADNQESIAEILHTKGAGISVKTSALEIGEAVKSLLEDAALRVKMSACAKELCDGKGTKRVVNELITASLSVRSAQLEDARFIYDARYAGDAGQYYRSQSVPSYEDHVSWLETALESKGRKLLCITMMGEQIAHIRLDHASDDVSRGEIGVALAEDYRGKGLSLPVLKVTLGEFERLGCEKVDAEVHEQNMASRKLFENAGFEYQGHKENGNRHYLYEVTPDC